MFLSWLLKILKFKIPEQWNDPDSVAFNVANLLFWAISVGVLLFLITKCGG